MRVRRAIKQIKDKTLRRAQRQAREEQRALRRRLQIGLACHEMLRQPTASLAQIAAVSLNLQRDEDRAGGDEANTDPVGDR